MHDTQLKGVVRCLRTMAGVRPSARLTDRQLLFGFADRGDQGAFAALVERHGPMVLRVCRRVLGQQQDAEDACQATFLILADKAGSIRKTHALASWLHGVAHRVSLRAKRDAGRRRAHEKEAQPMSETSQVKEAEWHEVQAALDEEIQALPELLRAAFVMCFLEGKSRAEVAHELGLKEGTVWSRLSRARKQLQMRLGRRGITLPALLTVAALSSGGTARALPVRLIHSTVEAAGAVDKAARCSAVSARVVALTAKVSQAMRIQQTKTVVLALVTAGMVCLGAGVALRASAVAQPPAAQPKESAARPAAPDEKRGQLSAIEDSGPTVTFKGRVVDANGKPVAGAEVTLWMHHGYNEGFYSNWHAETAGPFRPKPLGTAGDDGRFVASYRKSDVTENPFNMWEKPWRHVQIVAAAKGYAPEWATLLSLDKEELTFRLAKDDVSIKGRVLDQEGQAVVGAAIRVERVTVGGDVHNALWQPTWAGLSADCTTDRDGRFLLSGVGRDRGVLLSVERARNEQKFVEAKTPAAGNASNTAEVEVVVGPTKPVEGAVLAKSTGKPVAGVVVYGEEQAHHRRVRSVTDERGRYRLLGLPKAASYSISVYPPLELGLLGATKSVVDTEGLRPVTADIELRSGVEVRCRLVDKVTRELVRGEIRYTPLSTNPNYHEAELEPGLMPSREFMRHHVPDADGVFRFEAYPGPGLLVVILQGNSHRFLPGSVDPADLARAKGDTHMGFAKLFGIYRLIDPKEDHKPLIFDIELDSGLKRDGILIDPDGKPVAGATAFGLHHHPIQGFDLGAGERLESNTFSATLLQPGRSRTVSFVHKDRKLIGYVEMSGDDRTLVTADMRPWGELTGRLVDDSGKPLAGLDLKCNYPSLPAPGMARSGTPFTTDKEGRFRIDGLAPGPQFEITVIGGAKKDTVLSTGQVLKGLAVDSGQTKDLGDIKVSSTPAPQKKGGDNHE